MLREPVRFIAPVGHHGRRRRKFLPTTHKKEEAIMRFNLRKPRAHRGDTVNLAGGRAFTETAKLELASLLLTSTLQDQFYRAADSTAQRVKELVARESDKVFVAKAAVYARREAGLRSVTHLVAGELAKGVKGAEWSARFFDKIVRRPDDALEILAYYLAAYGKPLPNALKKGLGRALARFDAHQLAKYRKADAEMSLVDAVNLVHPPHTEALRALVNGTLAPAETWETKLTQAGQSTDDASATAVLKGAAWADLIRSRKVGYFALLRNLRNILEQASEVLDEALEMLVDEKLIRQSLVMPFRFTTALEAVTAANLPRSSDVLAALATAVDLSLRNVPRFAGRTLIALDSSGSMMGRPIKVGALFAATLVKANDPDLMLFSSDAAYLPLNRRDSTLTLAKFIEGKAEAASTNFHAIFRRARGPYDRVIILSDMQGWVGHDAPAAAYEAWKQKFHADPKVFSFDLQGYGTLMFPQRNIFCLAGFSDKTLETLHQLDADPAALVRQIEAVEL